MITYTKSNDMTSNRLINESITAHKNTKAFMTHGGFLGCEEALYFGVPMIGIPLYADQPRNIENFVTKNISIKLSLDDLTEVGLDAALRSILSDPKYR